MKPQRLLDRIKASSKLHLLVFVTCSFIVGIGAYGIARMRTMYRNTETIYADRIFPMDELRGVRFGYLDGIVSAAQKANFDRLSFPDAKKQILASEDSIALNWKKYKLTFLTQEEIKLVEEASALMIQSNATVEKLKAILDKEDANALRDLIKNDLYTALDPVILKLNELIRLQVRISGEIYKDSNDVFNTATRNFYYLIALSLAFAVPFSFYIVRNIKGLIRNLGDSNIIITEMGNKYRSLLENAGDPIFLLNFTTSFNEVNMSACALLGYSKEELLQMKAADIFSPEELERRPLRFDRIGAPSGFIHERRFRRKDGSQVDVDLNVTRLEGKGFLCIARDNTQRKRMEAQLIENQEKLTLFIEHSPAALAMFDTEMRYIATSNRWIRDNNLEGQQLVGRIHYDVVPSISQQWKEVHQRCLKGAVEKKEEDVFIRPDGGKEWLKWEIHPWHKADGEIGGIIMFTELITERKRATELFKYQFENSPDIILIVNKFYKIEAINKGNEDGMTVGQDCIAILPVGSQASARQAVRTCFETGQNQEIENSIRNNILVASRFVPIITDGTVSHVMIIATDITKRKQTEQQLRQSEEKHRALTENIADAIMLIDERGEPTYQSPSAERISGYLLEDGKGKTMLEYVHPDDAPAFIKRFEALRANPGSDTTFQHRIRHRNGNYIWIEGVSTNLLHDPSVGAIVSNYRDITARKEAEEYKEKQSQFLEEEVKSRTRQLNEAKSVAESANQTKGQFLANMSHEIRTPLNAVIGLSHLALKTQLSPKQEDYLNKIHSSSESLLRIINDILDFSKIEAGKLALEEVDFDLEEVMQKLADVITYKAHTKGLEIAFGRRADVKTHLVGDPIRLQQILNNLCSNSVKFTESGEVILMAKVAEESDDSIKLQFEIRDTGIGMNKKDAGKLFQPFTQADDSISRKFGGTGLGLSIVKHLVESMKGNVWVESRPGVGSTFYFTAWFKKQMRQHELPGLTIDLKNLNVLVVEDNPSSLQILKEALESFSFDVTAVTSGAEALRFLKERHAIRPVQLIIMDWSMPDLDGLQTTEIIRNQTEYKDTRIIMLCASYANEDLYNRMEELKLAGILIKPIKYSTLYDTIITAFHPEHHKKKMIRRDATEGTHANTGVHVLLVEDNRTNQQVASELLTGFGFSVDIANNGLEAVQMITAAEPSKFNLVLMDIQMPVMGGYKATTEIKKLPASAALPIIAMTADAMDGVREKCFEVGMVDFITKPINPRTMLGVLQKWSKPVKQQEIFDKTVLKKTSEDWSITKIDGINVKEGLDRLNGNGKLYHELLTRFLEEHKIFTDNVLEEFSKGEWSTGRRLVHTLKGTASNLGMMNVYNAAASAEKEINESKTQKELSNVLTPLKKELDYVLSSLENNLKTISTDASVISPELIKPMLHELDVLLEAHDPDAIKVLNKIGRVEGHEKEMDQINRATKAYDFDKARKILEELNLLVS